MDSKTRTEGLLGVLSALGGGKHSPRRALRSQRKSEDQYVFKGLKKLFSAYSADSAVERRLPRRTTESSEMILRRQDNA